MPKFSIVITTTRPRLVKYALRSALEQYFEDFEVIVSDNSEDGCREIVESFSDPRIRYVRPDTYMTTVPHWNFAFSHARGEWQLLLCDDDAMAPHLLATIDQRLRAHPEVQTVSWLYASYIYQGPDKWSQGDQFGIPPFSGAEEIVSSADLIREMFDSGTGLFSSTKRRIPFVPRSAYSREVIERIRSKLDGQLFLPPCPMTSGAIAALGCSERSLRLELPLYVVGISQDSAAAYTKDRTTYDRMNRGVEIELAPVKSMNLFPSTNADALLRVQAAMPEQLGRYELNLVNYFYACHLAILELEESDVDVGAEKDLIAKALAAQSPEIFGKVEARIAADLEGTKGKARGTLIFWLARIRNALQRAGAVLGYRRFALGRVLSTEKSGLRNIVDCAEYLTRLTRQFA